MNSLNKHNNHKYYKNIIELCDNLKYYNYNKDNFNNIISLLIKIINLIIDINLNYSNKLYKYYNNLLEIKNKTEFIIRNLFYLADKINNKTINIHIDNINNYLNKLNNVIDYIYNEYHYYNIRNNKLFSILYDVNSLRNKYDKLNVNINIFLKYNAILNLYYISENDLKKMLKTILQQYNNMLKIYCQNVDLILNYQSELYNKHVIKKIIFNSDYLNIDLQLFQFNI